MNDILSTLHAALPDNRLCPVPAPYLQESRRKWAGQGQVLITPHTVQEVATTIRTAAAHNVPVVPYGGGTGLVGGQIKPDAPAPLILSLEKMTAIEIHPQENTLIAQAGAILANVQAMARDHDRLFPLSLASEGTAQIGGLLATNAGGVNVLRYGNARDLALGLEAVLPDGSIWNGLKRLRKNNMGYDLRNLLIGSEGTLGIITAACLKLFPIPAQQGTALMVVPTPAAALDLLNIARDHMGDTITGFELISGEGLAFLRETMPDCRLPFAQNPDWMVLIELGLPHGLCPQTALETIFTAGVATDGLIAQSQTQAREFWTMRESIPEANRHIGALASHDVSLPLGEIASFIETCTTTLKAQFDIRINCFGHLGDGNLHFNLFPSKGQNRDNFSTTQVAKMTEIIHDQVIAMGGSISAEHGIGRLKARDLEHYEDPAKLRAMKAIKTALDPQNIMNPGAIFKP